MKKRTILTSLAFLLLSGIGTAWAASVSPYGQFGTYDKVALTMDRAQVPDKGVIIEGNLYIPAESLRKIDKLAYVVDNQSYQAHVFLGGNSAEVNNLYNKLGSSYQTKSKSQIASEIMGNIAYDTRGYHSGMMRQDILNIASLAKALYNTSEQMEAAIQLKLSVNTTPNTALIEQGVAYRSIPLELLEERMEVLAESLGDNLSSRDERDMEDVIDYIEDALENKQKSLRAFNDWIESSDEDDLEDIRDYEEDVKDDLADAIQILIGEDIQRPGVKIDDDHLQAAVDEWIRKKATK
ncbi:hypothetical protein [Brevibacillus dissolubilis]|uniref:hypothetical protein n=1 Tax=Brevibacillus dissolubilis TaxID=1844116 RepID=UPI0011167A34|nr:hypothetical protein [Brevibacillus dissolubilis]